MVSTSSITAQPGVFRDVASEVAPLAGASNMVMARLVAVTAAAIVAGDTDEAGMKSPAAWLAWRSGLSPERAGQLVRLAKVRDRYPVLFEAFERGEVSVDQMTELVKAPEWAQQQVLAFAEIGTVQRLRRAIRDDAFEHEPDEPAEVKAAREPDDRVSFGVRDGRWRITGDLAIDLGRRIEAAFVESKERLFDDGDPDATWVDALVDVAERSLDAVPSRDRRDRYRTWFHHDTTTGALTTTDGWLIPESIACAPVTGWPQSCTSTTACRSVWVAASTSCPTAPAASSSAAIVAAVRRGAPPTGSSRSITSSTGKTAARRTPGIFCALCSKHHRMHHPGLLGISGNADEPDGIEFTDARGSPIPQSCLPAPPGEPPGCERPYDAPPAGRMNYDWVGLGWAHPIGEAPRPSQPLAQHLTRALRHRWPRTEDSNRRDRRTPCSGVARYSPDLEEVAGGVGTDEEPTPMPCMSGSRAKSRSACALGDSSTASRRITRV